MQPHDCAEFLRQPHIGVLATLRRDGRPYTVPVWFLHDDDAFWITGTYERVWCKQLFADLSDGFVTIPGGTGTMDELWEALSWAQLGYHADPVGLLNSAGYYDHLIAFWDKMGEVGFLRPQHRDLLIVADTLDLLLDRMAEHVPTQPIVRMNASDL